MAPRPVRGGGRHADRGRRIGADPLEGYEVSLYRTDPTAAPELIATATTDAGGAFTIDHEAAVARDRVYYLLARSGSLTPDADAVTLAAVVGPTLGLTVTVNPLTTVATAYGMAQFLESGVISGSSLGIVNAASMARNVADPRTGALGSVLSTSPNATETSALPTVNSLANLVAACVSSPVDCDAIRTAATPQGGTKPADSLQALRNMVVEPGNNVLDLYALSASGPVPYVPARTVPPAAWTVALRFDGQSTGQGDTLEGPGNFALAADGSMWVALNYTYAAPADLACSSNMLARFSPNGDYYPGTPYSGGGLSGAGYGIEIDRYGDVWVSNFGFSAAECPNQPPHDTLSQFGGDGTQISPDSGYQIDGMRWPQGMEFDDGGNLWVANCESDNVTYLPDGDPTRARNLDLGVEKPFDVAFGSDGNAYVTGTFSNNVAVADPGGSLVKTYEGMFNRPMGIAADDDGNLWIADSGIVDLPCPNKSVEAVLPHTVGFIDPASGAATTFSGGGLVIPWGITVDGHGNIWVSNFGGGRISAFCGRDNSPWCPPGATRGTPLSPAVTGLAFDGLTRATAVHADTAGNMWVTNNWKEKPYEQNPGGYQVVVFLGLAGPLEAPAPEPKPAPAPTPVSVSPTFTG